MGVGRGEKKCKNMGGRGEKENFARSEKGEGRQGAGEERPTPCPSLHI